MQCSWMRKLVTLAFERGSFCLRRWPGDNRWLGESVFFYRIKLAGRGLSTPRFVPHCIAGRVLVGVRVCPPLINGILADEQFKQIAAVVVQGHLYPVPADHNVIPIPDCRHIARRAVYIAPDGLQVKFLIRYCGHISNHVYHGGRDPAEIVQLIELDIQPVTVNKPAAHGAASPAGYRSAA